MCLGGGSSKPEEPYDAYKSGDYPRWERASDRFARISNRLRNPDLDPAKAEILRNRKGNLKSRIKKFGNKADDDPSAELAMREYERQGDITKGKRKIDRHFDQFNDEYYGGYKQDYVDFYNPQLDKQFTDANGKLISALAGRGTLESTVGFDKIADLQGEKDLASTTIANEAQDAANELRTNVENSKQNLYSLNESAADPKAANALAQGQATALVAPPAFSPLGQVFANFLAPLVGAVGNRRASVGGSAPAIYAPTASGSGSGSVIG